MFIRNKVFSDSIIYLAWGCRILKQLISFCVSSLRFSNLAHRHKSTFNFDNIFIVEGCLMFYRKIFICYKSLFISLLSGSSANPFLHPDNFGKLVSGSCFYVPLKVFSNYHKKSILFFMSRN